MIALTMRLLERSVLSIPRPLMKLSRASILSASPPSFSIVSSKYLTGYKIWWKEQLIKLLKCLWITHRLRLRPLILFRLDTDSIEMPEKSVLRSVARMKSHSIYFILWNKYWCIFSSPNQTLICIFSRALLPSCGECRSLYIAVTRGLPSKSN